MPQNRTTVDGIVGNAKLLATSAAALIFQYLVQIVCGVYLSRAYIATPNQAYRTTEAILHAQPHAFIAGLHYWGTVVLILHGFAHVVALTWSGWYQSPRHLNWYGGLILFVTALLFQITGNVLPFDRHGVQTLVVESGIASGVPLLGSTAQHAMLQGDTFGPQTLATMYTIHHWVLPLLMLVGFFLALAGQDVRRAISKPLAVAPLVVVVALAFLIRAPHGSPATPADYTSYEATVSWYVWPMHGALQAFSAISPKLGWIGSAALPGLFGLFLAALPFIARRMTPASVRLTFSAFIVVFLACGLLFGGRFASLVGTRDPETPAAGSTGQPQVPMEAALAAKGREIFNSVGCVACHGQDGKHPSGGPNLATINQSHSDAGWYVKFIANPKSMKPASTMPAFSSLSQDQLRALAEYLRNSH